MPPLSSLSFRQGLQSSLAAGTSLARQVKSTGRAILPRLALAATLGLSSDQDREPAAIPPRDGYAACSPDNYAAITSITLDHGQSQLQYQLETGEKAHCDDLTPVQMRERLLEILNAVDSRYHRGEKELSHDEAVKIMNELANSRKNDALLAILVFCSGLVPTIAWGSYNKKQFAKLWSAIDATSLQKLSRLKKLLLVPKTLKENPEIMKKIAMAYVLLLAMGAVEAATVVPKFQSLIAGGLGFVEINTALREASHDSTVEPQAITAMRAELEHTRVEKTPIY